MNNLILGILILINKLSYLFSRSKKDEVDPLTRRVKRVPCKYESRRKMIHESGKEEDVVSCWREGKIYPIACLSFHNLCPLGIKSDSYVNETK